MILVTVRRGGIREQLLEDIMEKRRCSELKGVTIDRTVGRNCFRGSYRPVVKTDNEMSDCRWKKEINLNAEIMSIYLKV